MNCFLPSGVSLHAFLRLVRNFLCTGRHASDGAPWHEKKILKHPFLKMNFLIKWSGVQNFQNSFAIVNCFKFWRFGLYTRWYSWRYSGHKSWNSCSISSKYHVISFSSIRRFSVRYFIELRGRYSGFRSFLISHPFTRKLAPKFRKQALQRKNTGQST